uniref:Sugar transporter SWEET1 n=1 Tax=Amblyomma aureolatum TaxID=187763 RepID=A0A1E1X2H5_9ACAR
MDSTETIKTIVGDLALVFTIVNYASGVQICRKVREKGGTHDLSPLPFFAGILATFLWLEYGLMKEDPILIWVNAIGLLLQASFLGYFYSYTKVKATLNWKIFVLLIVLAGIYYEVTYFISNKDVALSIVGLMGCIAAFLFFASPLSSLLHVVRTQSVETLPFPLIMSAFIVSSLWTLYGFVCEDPFIYTPNIMGTLITACQLALFMIYPSGKHA